MASDIVASAMKLVFAAAFFASLVSASAIDYRGAAQSARTVYHTDGTYTESVQDVSLREQNEVTYSAQKVVIARKKYALNEKGQQLHGNIYDGRGELKARAQFFYDSFDRMTEQRMINLNGEVYQRIIFGYDAKGNPLPPKSETYDVKAPDMRAAPIDFTKNQEPPRTLDRSQGGPTPQQGNVPYLAEPTTPGLAPIKPDANGNYPSTQPTAQPEGEKKKGFFGKLFGGGKKKEEKK